MAHEIHYPLWQQPILEEAITTWSGPALFKAQRPANESPDSMPTIILQYLGEGATNEMAPFMEHFKCIQDRHLTELQLIYRLDRPLLRAVSLPNLPDEAKERAHATHKEINRLVAGDIRNRNHLKTLQEALGCLATALRHGLKPTIDEGQKIQDAEDFLAKHASKSDASSTSAAQADKPEPPQGKIKRETLMLAADAVDFAFNPTVRANGLMGCYRDEDQQTYLWNPSTDTTQLFEVARRAKMQLAFDLGLARIAYKTNSSSKDPEWIETRFTPGNAKEIAQAAILAAAQLGKLKREFGIDLQVGESPALPAVPRRPAP